MIAALLATATIATAAAPMSCHDAHVMVAAMNANRPAGAPPRPLQIVCDNDRLVSIGPATPPSIAERTPNLYHQPANCAAVVEGELARQQVALRGRTPAAQYAVERKLDGCGVPTPIGYHPNAAPGEADPTAKREDAPSNRR